MSVLHCYAPTNLDYSLVFAINKVKAEHIFGQAPHTETTVLALRSVLEEPKNNIGNDCDVLPSSPLSFPVFHFN